MYDSGEEFLNELYKDLHISKIVMHTALKNDTPVEKISKYLVRLDRVVKKAHQNEHNWNLFKNFCFSKYIIKEEDIKEEYINKNISPTFSREQVISKVTTAAKDSLDTWIDFLGSLDQEAIWIKFWIFKGITSMGNYDERRKTFSRRTKHTTSPFPMFDAAITLNIIDKIKLLIKTDDKKLMSEAINKESFAKLYAYYFTQKREHLFQDTVKTHGEWIHYEGLDDQVKLRKDIIGKGTLWCIENREDIKQLLTNDTIDIYFSYDANNRPTNPRLAIVSNNKNIKEIRGIERNQAVEVVMLEILEQRLLSYNQTEQLQEIITSLSPRTNKILSNSEEVLEHNTNKILKRQEKRM